jgi:hypothetical protein
MKPPSPRFAIAICGIVTVLSLWNIADFYQHTQDRITAVDPYGVLPQQARFSRVVGQLPAVSVFGYLNEPGLDAFTADKKLLGALYAVAPRMLVLQSVLPQQWVIGDFSRPIDAVGFARDSGMEVVKDFGGGIVLFQRVGRP